MSTRSFSSLFMVATCAGAALSCYLVSLRVASERARLENVETRIVLAQRDLRLLQTEIGTRGRLSQLERWNAGAFALGAPSADQFLRGSFELARLAQPEHKVDFQAPVVLAAAPAPESPRAPVGEAGTDDSGAPVAPAPAALLHVASLKTVIDQKNIGTREVPAEPAAAVAAGPKSKDKPVTAAKPALPKSSDKPGLAAAKPVDKPIVRKAAVEQPAKFQKKIVDKPSAVAAAAMTKPVRLAKNDPLAPLQPKHSGHSKEPLADR
jgi:hypothetical protein